MAILKTREIMKEFQIGSFTTVLEIFHSKGSPAFMVGNKWVCDSEELKEFLKERSKKLKG